MDATAEKACQWLRSLFSPTCLVVPCGEVQAACDARGISAAEMLAPYGRMGTGTVSVFAGDRTLLMSDARLRMVSPEDYSSRADATAAEARALSSLHAVGGQAGSGVRYLEYFKECVRGALLQEGITLLYPVAMMFVVPGLGQDPREAIRQSERRTLASLSKPLAHWLQGPHIARVALVVSADADLCGVTTALLEGSLGPGRAVAVVTDLVPVPDDASPGGATPRRRASQDANTSAATASPGAPPFSESEGQRVHEALGRLLGAVIAPHLGEQVAAHDDHVQDTRRGLKNKLKGFFGLGSSAKADGGAGSPAHAMGGQAPPLFGLSQGETTLRQLGDWSLHLQDYAGAASAHLMLASDLRPNKSGSDPSGWHQACAVLCAGLAQALGRKAWKDVAASLEQAAAQARACRHPAAPLVSSVALLVLSELAAATGGVPRATSMLVRAGAGEPVPSRAGVVLERLSMLYASLGMRRKAAMHLVLSGHQSQAARQPQDAKAMFSAAVRAYGALGQAFEGLRGGPGAEWAGSAPSWGRPRSRKGRWSALEEHMHFALVQHAQSVGDLEAATRHLAGLLGCAHHTSGSPQLHQQYLDAFVATVRALQQRDGGEGRLFQDLPFPSVSSESVRVLCAGRVCVGNAEAGESPESVWSDLEEPLLSLMDRPDKNYDATVIQWGTHVATGATHQAVAGEAMVVCVDVGNPLHVPVRMTAVTLDCTLVESPGAPSPSAASGLEVESRDVELAPKEKATVQFRVRAMRTGRVRISGMQMTLQGTVRARVQFQKRSADAALRVGRRPAGAGEGADDGAIVVDVAGGLPLPEGRIVGVPDGITAGELCRCWVVLSSAGPVPMTHLALAVSSSDVCMADTAWVRRSNALGTPSPSTAATVREVSQGLYQLDRSLTLARGDELWWACIVSPTSKGTFRCHLSLAAQGTALSNAPGPGQSHVRKPSTLSSSTGPGGLAGADLVRVMRLGIETSVAHGPAVSGHAQAVAGSTADVVLCLQVDNSREHRRCLRLLSVESVTPDWTLSALPTPDWVDPGDPDAEGGLTESGDSGVNLVAFGEGSEGRPVAGVAATTVKEVRPGAMEALVVRATLKSAADLKDAEGEGTFLDLTELPVVPARGHARHLSRTLSSDPASPRTHPQGGSRAAQHSPRSRHAEGVPVSDRKGAADSDIDDVRPAARSRHHSRHRSIVESALDGLASVGTAVQGVPVPGPSAQAGAGAGAGGAGAGTAMGAWDSAVAALQGRRLATARARALPTGWGRAVEVAGTHLSATASWSLLPAGSHRAAVGLCLLPWLPVLGSAPIRCAMPATVTLSADFRARPGERCARPAEVPVPLSVRNCSHATLDVVVEARGPAAGDAALAMDGDARGSWRVGAGAVGAGVPEAGGPVCWSGRTLARVDALAPGQEAQVVLTALVSIPGAFQAPPVRVGWVPRPVGADGGVWAPARVLDLEDALRSPESSVRVPPVLVQAVDVGEGAGVRLAGGLVDAGAGEGEGGGKGVGEGVSEGEGGSGVRVGHHPLRQASRARSIDLVHWDPDAMMVGAGEEGQTGASVVSPRGAREGQAGVSGWEGTGLGSAGVAVGGRVVSSASVATSAATGRDDREGAVMEGVRSLRLGGSGSGGGESDCGSSKEGSVRVQDGGDDGLSGVLELLGARERGLGPGAAQGAGDALDLLGDFPGLTAEAPAEPKEAPAMEANLLDL